MSINKSQSFDFIKKYIVSWENKDIAWVGDTFSPIECNQIVLHLSTNLRTAPIHHNAYEIVLIYAKSIFEYSNSWKLVLDESVRLLKDKGVLIIRSQDNEHGTLFELKSQLFRNKNLSVKLLDQKKCDDGFTISILEIKKTNIIDYNDKCWTIGILTNGKKEDVVVDLINSIRSANHDCLEVEFILAGPEINDQRLDSVDIKYVNTDIIDDLPRIAEKKNKIIASSKNENIAIFHDRYIVNNDFFDGFKSYGYNFEFLTIRQFYEDGSEFPAYIAFGKNEKRWQRPLNIINYNLSIPGSFINGGLIVLKKSILTSPLFNSLLLHNEAEDVEIAFHLAENGIIPRFNGFSSAKTVGITSDYTSSFIDVNKLEGDRGRLSGYFRSIILRAIFFVWKIIPIDVKHGRIRKTKIYEKIKNFVHSR